MKRISLKAVIVGGLTDVGLSSLFTIALSAYVMATLGIAGGAREQVILLIVQTIRRSVRLTILQIFIGSACSVLGGYVAATIARRHELLNGALASSLCVLLGIYSILSGRMEEPLMMQLIHNFTCPLLGLLGGYIRYRLVTVRGNVTPTA